MSTYTGKCHCGSVEWKAEMTPEQQSHILCHCDTCKQLSGAPYTLNQLVPQSALTFVKGKENLAKYTYTGDSGKGVDCFFCKTCTVHAYHVQQAIPDLAILHTVLLRGEDGAFGADFKPAAEIYGKARFGWEKELAHTFEVMPPQ